MTKQATAPRWTAVVGFAAAGIVLIAGYAGILLHSSLSPPQGNKNPMLLAPMIGVVEPCILLPDKHIPQ